MPVAKTVFITVVYSGIITERFVSVLILHDHRVSLPKVDVL